MASALQSVLGLNPNEPAVGYYFQVSLDDKRFAVFTKVDGLTASYDTTTIKEGGENTFVRTLPGRVKYDNVKLTRPVDLVSGRLAAWFTAYQKSVQEGRKHQFQNMAISACNAADIVVASWSLLEVVPVRYVGPNFSAGDSKVLTETLEFAHHGFWSGAPGSPIEQLMDRAGTQAQVAADHLAPLPSFG